MMWWRKDKEADTGEDWYQLASPEDRTEYNEFGPWLTSVNCAEKMPKIFRAWFEELKTAKYLFKIPIPLDRRVARPGMVLYKSVYAVSTDSIVILEWTGQ